MLRRLRPLTAALMLLIVMSPVASAANLSDLIRRRPQVYLPTQLLAGQAAMFTVQGKAGQHVKIIVSSEKTGAKLLNGQALGVGKATVSQVADIPASGVIQVPIVMPKDEDLLGDEQYVDAYVWTAEDQSDMQAADIIDASGRPAKSNAVAVGTPANAGSTLIIPGGDPAVTSLMRGISTMNSVGNDPRKRGLIDTGVINRNRQIDQNLNQSGPTLFRP